MYVKMTFYYDTLIRITTSRTKWTLYFEMITPCRRNNPDTNFPTAISSIVILPNISLLLLLKLIVKTNINCKQLPFIISTRREIPFSFEVSSRAIDFYQYFSIDLCFWLCCRLLTIEQFTLLSNNFIYGGNT